VPRYVFHNPERHLWMRKKTEVKKIIPEFGFGDRVRKARLIAGLGSKEMSAKLGTYPTAVTYWERVGQPRDLWGTCNKIADLTGVDPFWLLTGEAPPKGLLCGQVPCVCGMCPSIPDSLGQVAYPAAS
jgi:hypothetical protein